MTVVEAQHDLGRAYVGGGPGAVVSSLVWIAAAIAASRHGVATAFTVLFFGGVLIFPLSKLVCRTVFRRANEQRENPLGATALECTIAMIGGLFAAWLYLPLKPALVFPLAAIAVGTHYLVFKTVYGDRTFWALAALMTGIGFAGIFAPQLSGGVILPIALVELAFGIFLTVRSLRVA